jgi:hypothetical protein
MFSKSTLRFVLVFLLSIPSASWGGVLFDSHPRSYNSGGWDAYSIAVEDLNGDGNPDLVLGNYACVPGSCSGGAVSVLLGNGDGTFQLAVSYYSGGEAVGSAIVADVNGDGKFDLLVANLDAHPYTGYHGAVGVLLGNGDGTFQAAASYDSGGWGADSISATDVNGDGRTDLLVANACLVRENCTVGGVSGNVGVLLGNGDGTFHAAVTYGSGGNIAVSIAAGDMNADGKPDLLVANRCIAVGCPNGGVITVLQGNGDGTFRQAIPVNSGVESYSMAVADVNHDGKLDLLVGGYSTVAVLLGNGDGTLKTVQRYTTGGEEAQSIAVGDVNADGMPDLLTASKCPWEGAGHKGKFCLHGVVSVLLGNGDGTFRAPKIYGSLGNDATSVALGDVNRDSRPDMLVANLCAHGSNCNGEGGAVVRLSTSRFRTTTSLSSSPNPSFSGQPVTLTATVTSANPIALTGTVTFRYGTNWLGKGTLTAGVVTLTTRRLPAGTSSITAKYNGNSNSAKSTSEVLIQVVH